MLNEAINLSETCHVDGASHLKTEPTNCKMTQNSGRRYLLRKEFSGSQHKGQCMELTMLILKKWEIFCYNIDSLIQNQYWTYNFHEWIKYLFLKAISIMHLVLFLFRYIFLDL